MPGSIFVSYRREDSAGYAGRIFDHLAGHFGEHEIFRDVDTLKPGQDFVETLQNTVGTCKALIAIIGQNWLTITDREGRPRLSDPHDFVRLEVGVALERRIPVIPVLLENAGMPRAEQLPDDLKDLRRRQALDVSDKRFEYDVQQLIEALEGILRAEPASVAQPFATPGEEESASRNEVALTKDLVPAAAGTGSRRSWKYVVVAVVLLGALFAGKELLFTEEEHTEDAATFQQQDLNQGQGADHSQDANPEQNPNQDQDAQNTQEPPAAQ